MKKCLATYLKDNQLLHLINNLAFINAILITDYEFFTQNNQRYSARIH